MCYVPFCGATRFDTDRPGVTVMIHLKMFFVRDASSIGIPSIYVSIDFETVANVLYSMALSPIELFISSL